MLPLKSPNTPVISSHSEETHFEMYKNFISVPILQKKVFSARI